MDYPTQVMFVAVAKALNVLYDKSGLLSGQAYAALQAAVRDQGITWAREDGVIDENTARFYRAIVSTTGANVGQGIDTPNDRAYIARNAPRIVAAIGATLASLGVAFSVPDYGQYIQATVAPTPTTPQPQPSYGTNQTQTQPDQIDTGAGAGADTGAGTGAGTDTGAGADAGGGTPASQPRCADMEYYDPSVGACVHVQTGQPQPPTCGVNEYYDPNVGACMKLIVDPGFRLEPPPPSPKPKSLPGWVLPVAAIGAGALALYFAFRKR